VEVDHSFVVHLYSNVPKEDTFRVAAEVGSKSLGAYVISIASKASDILAMELLQKDARLAIRKELGRPCSETTLRVVPQFENAKDLRGVGSVIWKLSSIDWHRNHIIANDNGHQEVMDLGIFPLF